MQRGTYLKAAKFSYLRLYAVRIPVSSWLLEKSFLLKQKVSFIKLYR